MGRPLNKKYFGKRNTGAAGTFGNTNLLPTDYDLGGLKANGVTVGTAGSYTGTQVAAPLTVTFPAPALASEGATTATGTVTGYKYLSGSTLTGTQTVAYTTGAGTLVASVGSTSITFTPTLTTYSGLSIGSVTTGGVVTLTGGTFTGVKGTSVTFDAGLTGTTGLTAGATYYVTTSVSSSSTITLASTYALAVAGTAITIAGGTPTGTLTLTVGTTYASVASIALVSGGTGITVTQVAAMIATPVALTQSTSSGAGATLTSTAGSSNFGVTDVTLTNGGNGYINTVPVTPSITSTTLTAISAFTSSGFSSTSLTGSYLLATPQSAGTFYVGQVLTLTGTNTGTTITGYSTGKSYLVKTTNGTSTFTLTNIDGTAVANGTASGDIVGLTINLYKATVSSTDQLVPGFKVVTTGTGGSLTASTYYIIAVNGATEIVLSSSAGGNATAVTSATSTATTVVSGNIAATFSVASAAANLAFAAQVTTGYTGNYAAIQAQALSTTGGVVRQDTDIIKQENTQRFRVENADGVFYAKLVNAFPTVGGTMAINATDFNGSTYWVTKITNRRCRVTQNVVKTSFQFADGATVNWTFGSAVTGVSVKIDNA
jgi:hypothetical protein